jgi:hypothetical protein
MSNAESVGNQHGYLCPKCGKGDELTIFATVSVKARLFPDGTDNDGVTRNGRKIRKPNAHVDGKGRFRSSNTQKISKIKAPKSGERTHAMSQKSRNKKSSRRSAPHRSIEPEEYQDVLDEALTAAEASLRKLLPSILPEKIADDFRHHVDTHLADELENIREHGHRNDTSEDIPEHEKINKERELVELLARMTTQKENQSDAEDAVRTLDDLIVLARKTLVAE